MFTYEVVSIRPSRCETGGIRSTDDGIYFECTTLENLMPMAYELRGDYVFSAPDWMKSEPYDIAAKMDSETAKALKKLPQQERALQQDRMMKTVLEDRFHLQVRRGKKEIATYDLVIAKGGLKIKDADPNKTYSDGIIIDNKPAGAGAMHVSSGRMIAQGVSMDMLTANLAGQVESPVNDKTGLKGRYDLTIFWKPEEPLAPASDGLPNSIFTALQEQVGLKLIPSKGITDTVIVEHVERPTPN